MGRNTMKIKNNKRLIIVFTIFFILIFSCVWYLFLGGRIKDVSSDITKGTNGTDSIIVYFSRSGVVTAKGDTDAVSSASLNTNDGVTDEAAAQLQKITGADMYQIRTKRYYRNAFMGTAATAWIEEKLNTRPALAAQPENLDQYSVIYVGFPVWWFNAPMAIGSFLESYDLSGKTVVPFCTSESNGIDVCMDYIREVSGKGTVTEGYRFHQSTNDDSVRDWLDNIGILEEGAEKGGENP